MAACLLYTHTEAVVWTSLPCWLIILDDGHQGTWKEGRKKGAAGDRFGPSSFFLSVRGRERASEKRNQTDNVRDDFLVGEEKRREESF
mmetsp:Transcript_37545/g.73841  ORF Transcript_37545/g.73841 Transcript_37545/m.73841 type:complete len:88 (-) Transcript_37545:440-703(-)